MERRNTTRGPRQHPDLAKMWQHIQNGTLPEGWDKDIPTFPADAKGIATRESDSKVLNAVAKNVPWLLGGAADLSSLDQDADQRRPAISSATSYAGRNFHFGIREHTMGSILNGMAALRTARLRSDVPHLLRLHAAANSPGRADGYAGASSSTPTTPSGWAKTDRRTSPSSSSCRCARFLGCWCFRPADANEVAETWRVIMPDQASARADGVYPPGGADLRPHKYASAAGVAKGAYILADSEVASRSRS